MKNSKTILHESLGKGVLQQSIGLPYDVPEGYFDSLATTILERLPKGEAQLLAVSQPPFSVPEAYFDRLSNNVLSIITVLSQDSGDEAVSVDPLLNTISSQLPYQTPEGYFENLTLDTELFEQPKDTKVISIATRVLWLRMAVAASIVGVVLLAATIFYQRDNGGTYASYKNIDLNKSVNKLSDDDLIKYLDNDYIASNTETIILDDGVAPSLEQDAQAVPDNDMAQYLREVSKHKRRKKGI